MQTMVRGICSCLALIALEEAHGIRTNGHDSSSSAHGGGDAAKEDPLAGSTCSSHHQQQQQQSSKHGSTTVARTTRPVFSGYRPTSVDGDEAEEPSPFSINMRYFWARLKGTFRSPEEGDAQEEYG